MKKLLFILLMIGLIFSGCGKKSGDGDSSNKAGSTIDTSSIKTSPVENQNQKFDLRYKFDKGVDYHYRMASFSQNNQSIIADSSYYQNMKQSTIYLMDVNLKNIEKDSVINLTCKITSINFEAEVNGKFYTYQSGVTKDSSDLEKFAEYVSLINNPFNVAIHRTGGIINISNIDQIMNKFLILKKLLKQVSLIERERLGQNIIEGSLKPLVINVFREMTPNTVAKDSTWSFKQPPAPFLIFTLNNTNTYKISKLEKYKNDLLASIEAGLKTEVKGSTTYKQGGAIFQFKEPQTSASGNIYFNITKGCIQKSNVETKANIFYTKEIPGKPKGSNSEVITSSNVVELL